jgi:hypothetical protein
MVTPLSEFEQAQGRGERMYYEQGQGHWNVQGNELAAEVMAKAIIESRWCNQQYTIMRSSSPPSFQ